MAFARTPHIVGVAVALLVSMAAAQGPLPALTAPVNDFAHVIDAESAGQIDRLSRTLQAASGDVVVVATVSSIEPYSDVREYAVELFENRGSGIGERARDNGVLVLLAVQERSVWIEVGYGLEEWVTDGFAGETSRAMAPAFREGRFGPGLVAGVARVVQRIADGRNITLTGIPVPSARPPGGLRVPVLVIVLMVIVLIVLSQGGGGRGLRRRRRWGGWSSGVGPFGGAGWGGRGWSRGGGFGGGFGGFGGGRSGGGGGGARW